MRPDSELLCMIPRVAWTGGDPPKALRDISRQELSLVREAFRESMRASIRDAHRSGLYRTAD